MSMDMREMYDSDLPHQRVALQEEGRLWRRLGCLRGGAGGHGAVE